MKRKIIAFIVLAAFIFAFLVLALTTNAAQCPAQIRDPQLIAMWVSNTKSTFLIIEFVFIAAIFVLMGQKESGQLSGS